MAQKRKIIECVPNFSEGRNVGVIEEITRAVRSVEGVSLLHIDSGDAANRTVVTFAGEPGAVCEAAFRAAKVAAELIDMRQQSGTHPRLGATDVLPIVPVSGISLDECAALARRLAARLADEAHIPCYCYEAAAFHPERRKLEHCRAGEYEGLPAKLASPATQPDFGARPYDEGVAHTGCTIVGARPFLIAVNFNLDSVSAETANEIARDVRERGRVIRENGSSTGAVVRDAAGRPMRHPGTLRGVKAIGWFIREYGCAQVSTNITDIGATPLHTAFEEISRTAARRGLRITGTEIIGLVPESVLTDAGAYFLRKRNRPADVPKDILIAEAVRAMNLSDLRPFCPEEKVLEYRMEGKSAKD